MDERLAKTLEAIRQSGADWAILSSPDAVAYASGHIVPIETGPSPFGGGPSLALIGPNGECGLVCTNIEGGSASRANEIARYVGFPFDQSADVFANYVDAATSLARRMGVSGTIAIERRFHPHSLSDLTAALPLVEIEPALARARAVKTAEEIERLRTAARAASAGQRAFYAATRPGRTELAVFADIRLAIETEAGERVPFTGDFMSGGERTSALMGWPGNRVLRPGDSLVSDLAPRIGGYWGDSCASAVIGEPSPQYRRLFETVQSALALAVAEVRPGLAVAELDRMLVARVTRDGYAYLHHSGHSIGTSVHEWPRLVQSEPAVLEPDMVIMVEPHGHDADRAGVRLEWMLRVTATGCEVLTDFEHQPSIPF